MEIKRPVVIAGSIAIDRIMSFDGSYSDHLNPEKLDAVSVSIFIDHLTYNNGGVGANIAYNVALLGDEPYLVGSVGPDGIEYLEWLAKHGVNITHVHESKLPTATFSVITDKDQNQIGGFYPGAMFDTGTLTLSDWYKSNPVVVVAPHDPKSMKKQVEECIKHNLSLVYDIGQQVSNTPDENLRHGVDAAEILILNEYELSVLAKKIGRTVEDISEKTPIVVTTFVPNGSTIA
ncbi:carbohydrate kinase family protein, partial [Candidatus Saccharibacteria bacterium]|nr:carbohydrate kinase family protein [Candidatus Saccharibacteria bacterium]